MKERSHWPDLGRGKKRPERDPSGSAPLEPKTRVQGMVEERHHLEDIWILSRSGRQARTCPPAAMRVLSWNWRGSKNQDTVKALMRLVKNHNPNCLFFIETKSSRGWMEKIKVKTGFQNSFFIDPKGRTIME